MRRALSPTLALAVLGAAAVARAGEAAPAKPEIVSFASGAVTLRGYVYRPAGAGPFPALLYNHGSAPGMANDQAFLLLGPRFAARGWLFFAPYRRGQGLSAAAGRYVMDDIEAARQSGGREAAAATMMRRLEGDQLDDQLAALAWLRQQPFVDGKRIAAAGNSFGGVETLLGVERERYCAGVAAAAGAMSWDASAELRRAIERAGTNARAPLFVFQAANDFSTGPTATLASLFQRDEQKKKTFATKLYPPYGTTPQQGHSFAWRGVDLWLDDVLRFLDARCRG